MKAITFMLLLQMSLFCCENKGDLKTNSSEIPSEQSLADGIKGMQDLNRLMNDANRNSVGLLSIGVVSLIALL
ncbi:hypothetical protein MHBO_003686 [Bonamia ostreae]|uniref:Uncharacterized protein n=1 Tax=Bonamia ostreae TaxID=126728 RepID=A0ABV2AR74_9EUKA